MPLTRTTNDERRTTGPTGFTLVELIIVGALFTVIMGALIAILLTGRSSYLSTSAYIQVQHEARRAFDPIVREIREARMSTATPTTALANGAVQLNFQVARGYNLNATDPACPANDVCWGSDLAANGWVHYSIIDTGNPRNPRQLLRCADGAESTAITAMGVGCRVLANYVLHPNTANSAAFAYDTVNRMVTANLQFEYADPVVPTGRLTMPLMSARIRLRN